MDGRRERRSCRRWFVERLESREMYEPEAALRAAYAHARATVPRHPDVVGIDAHLLLVGPAGVLLLGSDGNVVAAPSVWAIGCGEHVALGYLAGRQGTPPMLADGAVRVACQLVDGCFGVPVVRARQPQDD